MTKEDRYSHLGDGIEETTDDATDGTDVDAGASEATEPTELSVTIRDGDEETTLTFDPEEVSADDLQAAMEGAPGETAERQSATDPGQLALELGTLGPRLAVKGMESLLQPNRADRD